MFHHDFAQAPSRPNPAACKTVMAKNSTLILKQIHLGLLDHRYDRHI
jgi:hypothetical protein